VATQHSKHPAARAVAEVARRARLELPWPENFEEIPGRGVRATHLGQEILVGRASWLAERGARAEEPAAAADQPLSVLHVTRAGQPLGWIGLEDKTRPEAATAMDELRRMGLKELIMVTGDRLAVARRVADEMHCTDLRAEALPAQKLELVSALRSRGHVVAVVGDGVNDAPALAAGDLSIAMGAAGSDVAIHSSSVALMNDRLNRVPFLIRLSRATTRVVRQNLGFGLAFIVVFECLSAWGLVPPLLAAVLHVLASVVVIFNSARLVRQGEELEEAAAGPAPEAPSPAPRPALA
jgi:Cd2+/Zn2+-exporting ATPase